MHEPYLKAMAALLRRCQPRHDLYTVFGDCMEAMAIAMVNSVDLRKRDSREARYLDIVGRYQPDIVDLFPRVLAQLVHALEAGPGDVLFLRHTGIAFYIRLSTAISISAGLIAA